MRKQVKSQATIWHALDGDSKLIHIDDASQGYGHGYTCPLCKKELGARKGEQPYHCIQKW